MFKAWFIKIPIDLHIQNSYLRPKQGVSIIALNHDVRYCNELESNTSTKSAPNF